MGKLQENLDKRIKNNFFLFKLEKSIKNFTNLRYYIRYTNFYLKNENMNLKKFNM